MCSCRIGVDVWGTANRGVGGSGAKRLGGAKAEDIGPKNREGEGQGRRTKGSGKETEREEIPFDRFNQRRSLSHLCNQWVENTSYSRQMTIPVVHMP